MGTVCLLSAAIFLDGFGGLFKEDAQKFMIRKIGIQSRVFKNKRPDRAIFLEQRRLGHFRKVDMEQLHIFGLAASRGQCDRFGDDPESREKLDLIQFLRGAAKHCDNDLFRDSLFLGACLGKKRNTKIVGQLTDRFPFVKRRKLLALFIDVRNDGIAARQLFQVVTKMPCDHSGHDRLFEAEPGRELWGKVYIAQNAPKLTMNIDVFLLNGLSPPLCPRAWMMRNDPCGKGTNMFPVLPQRFDLSFVKGVKFIPFYGKVPILVR